MQPFICHVFSWKPWIWREIRDSTKFVEQTHKPSFKEEKTFLIIMLANFLSDPGKPGVRSLGPDVRHWPLWDLTEVTLADEDANSIPT